MLLAGLPSFAQTLTNQALNGKYFFRHVSLGIDASSSITDPRSLIGTMTFDGNGRYTFNAQQLSGASNTSTATGSGSYSVDPAGIVSMDNPLRSGMRLNARVGPEALVGSSTEATDNVFDMLVAVPAPSGGSAMAGITYWAGSLEFPGLGRTARNSFYSLPFAALGRLNSFQAVGHASNLGGGQVGTQVISGSTYTVNADGSGTLIFGPSTGPSLISGMRTFYISKSGNVILGGSTGMHDILVGVKAPVIASNTTFNGNFWTAGLRFNAANQGDVSGYSGSMAARGQGLVTSSRRVHQLAAGSYDFTGVNGYSLSSNGSGATELTQIALGLGGTAVVSSAISQADPGAYEIYFSVQMAPLTGPGVFLNPQGVTSAASFFPAGTPISPGEFVALFGTGMAKSDQTASPPYPLALNGVTVLINDQPAPLQFVSANRINCLVPYGTQGATATVVVQNAGVNSNSVVVPLAQTVPGIFSLDQTGTGLGAVLHLDGSPVTLSRPAAGNEAVSIYLTGMGAVNPAVQDGTAGGSNPLSQTTASPTVLVGGIKANVLYSGLAPGYPGLYQINIQLPAFPPSSGALPLAIQTDNAFHDQVDIAIR